jgi:hypothetical protein
MSDEIDDGGPAFPHSYVQEAKGMSLRDWFAGKAMQGLINSDSTQRTQMLAMAGIKINEWLVKTSFAIADEMLKERKS